MKKIIESWMENKPGFDLVLVWLLLMKFWVDTRQGQNNLVLHFNLRNVLEILFLCSMFLFWHLQF